MRYSPSSEFDSVRVWRRVIGYFLIGGLLVIGGFGYWAWLQTEQQIHDRLHIEARLAANSARSVFQGLTDDLPYLALQLSDRGGASLVDDYGLLKTYQDHHPYVASFVLFSPDGRMLLNTARPCCSVGLPDPRMHPAFLKSLRKTLNVPGVWIGQTQKGLVLHDWRIPVRYVIRDEYGNARMILQASVLLSYLVKQWVRDPLLADTALGLLRMDGLHIARLPAPDPQRLYDTRMTGPLATILKTDPTTRSGAFDGVVGADGQHRIGEYVRLSDFPVVAYASAPWRLVIWQWWNGVSPFLGLGLLSLAGFVGLTRMQVLRERRHASELADRARRNVLTGLPNRFALMEWLNERLAQQPSSLVLLRVDLADFHDINTALGPHAGDQTLLETARRIRAIGQAAGGFVAHGGGDEFDIALPGATLINANGLAHALLSGLGAPLEIDGRILRLQAGIGIGCYPQDAQDSAGLLRVVDSALYSAKLEGKSAIALYDPASGDLSNARVSFQHSVERALDGDEFLLHYQPMVRMRDGKIVSVEALVRWNDPDRGMVPPGEFIPLAESTGRIGAIGDWVFRRACRAAASWLRDSPDLRVSINLSAVQFNSPDLIGKLRRELRASEVPADNIEVEVTETAVMQDVERSLGVLNGLHALGLSLAIDDFGTGYSSLAYLRRLPAQIIKIDQSFVRDLDTDPEDLAIVRAIVALAKALGRRTIAEGIENARQWRLLQGLGVDYGQGYWLSRPLPEAELRRLLRRDNGYLRELRERAELEG
ncbi:MAG: EAL domain-containing protein [Acidihalobacter sp.]